MSVTSKKTLLIVGAGGYGQLVKEIAFECGYDSVDFLDDNNAIAIGKIEELNLFQKNYDGCVVAIGNPTIRAGILKNIDNPVSLVHPNATVYKSAVIESGCIVEANAVISASAIVRQGSFICAGAVVNHNAEVEEFCQIDCNAVVAAGKCVSSSTKVDSCTVWK